MSVRAYVHHFEAYGLGSDELAQESIPCLSSPSRLPMCPCANCPGPLSTMPSLAMALHVEVDVVTNPHRMAQQAVEDMRYVVDDYQELDGTL